MKFLERICEASRGIPERLEHYTHGGKNPTYPGEEWRVICSGDSFLEINFLFLQLCRLEVDFAGGATRMKTSSQR